jgi:uncharacterized membrane-anchored protein
MQKLENTIFTDIQKTLIQAETAIKEMNNKKKFLIYAFVCSFLFLAISSYHQYIYIKQNNLGFLPILALGVVDGVIFYLIIKVFQIYKTLNKELKDMSEKYLYLKDLFSNVEDPSNPIIEKEPNKPSIMQ